MHPLDYTIIGLYLLGVVWLGAWVGRGHQDLSGYLLGNRSLPWWALLGSIVATETSTATFLSIPGLAYRPGGDLRFLQLAMGFALGRCLVVVVLLPAYFRGQMFTAYEVLNRRFGGATQRMASLLFLVARNLGDGLRLFLAALVLHNMLRIPLAWCIVLVAAVTIAYTLLGGMRSVVWNDCIQLVIYLAGGVLALVVMLNRLPGGWQQVLEFASDQGKLRLFDGRWDVTESHTLWAGLVGGAFLSLGTHGTDQMMVQRYLSARHYRDAVRALLASGLVVFAQFALFLFVGIALACYFGQYPPEEGVQRMDEALAVFIIQEMPVGVAGLTLAAVFAAAMSTLSSSLNSSAAALVNDFGVWWRLDRSSAERRVTWCRWLTVVFGLIQIVIAIGAAGYSDSVVNDALAIAGFTNGILLGLFALGVLTRRVGQRAALIGLVAGTAAVSFAKFATLLAWPWYTVIGALATFGAALLAAGAKKRDSGREGRPESGGTE
jgi:solute:Na+ symporter, SSS family